MNVRRRNPIVIEEIENQLMHVEEEIYVLECKMGDSNGYRQKK